jgi:hypothetical protein
MNSIQTQKNKPSGGSLNQTLALNHNSRENKGQKHCGVVSPLHISRTLALGAVNYKQQKAALRRLLAYVKTEWIQTFSRGHQPSIYPSIYKSSAEAEGIEPSKPARVLSFLRRLPYHSATPPPAFRQNLSMAQGVENSKP